MSQVRIVFGSRGAEPLAARDRVSALPPVVWPFCYPLAVNLPSRGALIVDDLHEAFVNHQTANTRLVTTQAAFLIQSWLDVFGERDLVLDATADRASLEQHAPEVLQKRGVFADAVIQTIETVGADSPGPPAVGARPGLEPLVRAFRTADPRERLALCIEALDEAPTPGALLATASVCMEVNDLDAAARELDECVAQAPQWAAAHFERGKLWLRRDDMEQASLSFRAAAERMPRFGPAWANLGATLGELDRPDEALAAFERALACDPRSPQTLNNIGVVQRELGRLPASETSFKQVIALAPTLAFGYYNLGHTLFLQGRYTAALAAYADGQQRDPERNPVQATRLAMCRLATGDAAGAIAELERATRTLPRDYRQQVLADTHTIAWALLTHRPDLPGWSQVNDWLTREQTR